MSVSFKAKGVFLYFWSKPDDWEIKPRAIEDDWVDGQTVVYNALKELETAGYLYRKRYYINGKVAGINYNLSDTKEFDNDLFNQNDLNQEKLNQENKDEYIDIQNKDINKTKTIQNKDTKKQTDNLKSFQDIQRFFQNKCNDSIDENLEIINNDFSKDEITLLAEFAINRIKDKGSKAPKNTKAGLRLLYSNAARIKASLASSSVDFKEVFRKDEDVYIYLMRSKDGLVTDSLDQWTVDRILKDKQIKKNNSTKQNTDAIQDHPDEKIEKLITEIKSQLLEYPDDFYKRSGQCKRTTEDWRIIENNSKIHEKYNIKDYSFILEYILEIKQPCGKKGVPRAEFMSSYKNEFINTHGASSVLALYNYFIAIKDEKFFPSVEDYGK
jgi:hypothetical protein